jgi:hypothetical protein
MLFMLKFTWEKKNLWAQEFKKELFKYLILTILNLKIIMT